MKNSLYHIITKKLWRNYPNDEKLQLFKLLLTGFIIFIAKLILFLLKFEMGQSSNCLLCDIGILALTSVFIFLCLKGKQNLAIYFVFSIPLFLYGYYISEFSQHPPYFETVYVSLWWLIAGILYLFYFNNSNTLSLFFYILSVFTIALQLFKANRLFDSISSYDPFITNPLIVLTIFYLAALFFRIKYTTAINRLAKEIKNNQQKINTVFQDSSFSVAQLKAEVDEEGNVVKIIVERVNNTFESKFKINLHEVENQEAAYIFNVIFRNDFDVYKTLFEPRKVDPVFQVLHLEKWFKTHVIKPGDQHYFFVFEDITTAKNELFLLEESRDRYKVLLEAIPDIYSVIDKDGTYEDFVIKESHLFKVEDANIIGSSLFEVGFSNKMAAKILLLINNCIRNNKLETIEYSLNTPNGTLMFEMRMAKLNANSVIAISRDITSRKTIQFNLSKALKKAEESDQLKSAFLSNLSHEIRTPLNIITNFTRMLTEPMMEEEEKYSLSDAISQNSQQLMKMIDNTIHLSKIETDTVEVTSNFCPINNLLRNIYNHYMPIIPDSKNVRLQLMVDVQNKEFGFETDATLLKESLEIFVDNALKYTEKGTVKFGYEMIMNEAVKFFVSDTGIGIPDEEKEHIFSRFYRVKNDINRTTSGSGIGLPIAQHYIQLIGGELQLESSPNKGTTLSFILPFNNGKGYMKLV